MVGEDAFRPIASLSKEDLLAGLRNLYGSFKKFDSVELENKTTNFHNCRKSALLSQLLIKNKLLTIIGVNGSPSIEAGIKAFVERNTNAYKT